MYRQADTLESGQRHFLLACTLYNNPGKKAALLYLAMDADSQSNAAEYHS